MLYAASPLWTWEQSIALEKEQLYKASFAVGEVQKELMFRWTLYKNAALVIHLQYDKFNHQFLLYNDYQRNAYRIPLGMGSATYKDTPHLAIYFKSFADKKAYFNLYIEGQGASVLNESFEPPANTNTTESQDAQDSQGAQ